MSLSLQTIKLQKRAGETKMKIWKPGWVKVSRTNDENTDCGAYFDFYGEKIGHKLNQLLSNAIQVRMLTTITLLVFNTKV